MSVLQALGLIYYNYYWDGSYNREYFLKINNYVKIKKYPLFVFFDYYEIRESQKVEYIAVLNVKHFLLFLRIPVLQ